jgi:uncharacterized membrane protein
MHARIGRALVAAASSAGLLLGGAMTASASSADHGHDDHGKKDYGWVKVCQNVKYADAGDNDYKGTYQVKDSYGSAWKFDLKGKYACRQVKVHKGKAAIKVVYKPDYTDLYGYADRYVDVKKDHYTTVSYDYKALPYGWVKVCQDVKKYGGYDDSEYKGTYQVKDGYGVVSRVYLRGAYDCQQVKVHVGKADVKVLYKPDGTELLSYEDVYVDVYKGAYEQVTFSYKAVAYGWVKVCQNVRKYGDDENADYKGTYQVKDSYGDTSTVYLEGAYDCEQVKVHAGKADVKVVYKPDYTELLSYDDVYVDVYKDAYAQVVFEYQAKPHYSISAQRAA